MQFYKYQGTGNDFIMIDNRSGHFPDFRTNNPKAVEQVRKLCNRRFGIGGDGLILIENTDNYDFECVYFNSDGSQSLCGNGSRCAVKFASFLGIIENKTTFLAIDGPHVAFIKDDLVHLKMGDVSSHVSYGVKNLGNFHDGDMFLDTGSPHHVQWVEQVSKTAIVKEGAHIRYNTCYAPNGTNVNFAEVVKNNQLKMRTYERGVENETLSCGTGATAVALAAAIKYGFRDQIELQVEGGTLHVSFSLTENNTFEEVYLIGPAENVFKGEI